MQLELPLSDKPPPLFTQTGRGLWLLLVGLWDAGASGGTEGGGISGCFAEEVPWCTSHCRGTSCCASGSCSLHRSPLPRCALIPSSLWEAGSSQRRTSGIKFKAGFPGTVSSPVLVEAGQEVGSKLRAFPEELQLCP